MTALLLLLAQLTADSYRIIPLSALATTRWTHACVIGPVVYVRRQRDGDVHITLDDGTAKVVAEIIPQVPLSRPRKGMVIRVCGVTRIDKHHGWPEIHPVLSWTVEPKR